jgi:hypothetical protein
MPSPGGSNVTTRSEWAPAVDRAGRSHHDGERGPAQAETLSFSRSVRTRSISSSASSAQIVRARDVFAARDVRFGQEYVDFVWVDKQGLRHIDYARIAVTRAVSTSTEAAEDAPALKRMTEPADVGQATEERR